MNDSVAQDAVYAVMAFILFVAPLYFVIPAILKRHKILGGAFNGVRNLASNAAKAAGKAGKKAASNTATGQRLKQELAARKAANVRKGQEAYLKNGGIFSKFMTPASKDIYNRELDKQRRAKRSSDIKDINEGLTGSVASAIGNPHENLGKMLKDIEANPGKKHYWRDSAGRVTNREVADEDIAAMRSLRQQGFIDSNDNMKKDSMLATAAMQKVFSTELAGEQNIAGISSMLSGASAEENRDYSEQLRSAAAAAKYKNFAGASVSDGKVNQYFAKTAISEFDPSGARSTTTDNKGNVIDTRLEGARKVLASGLRGINKDALDKVHDESLLNAIEVVYDNTVNAQGQVDQAALKDRENFIIKTADETTHIEKRGVLDQIAGRLGVSTDQFIEIQRSIRSGGAVAMPKINVSAKTNKILNAPTPTPPPTLPPQQQAAPSQMSGSLNIPHGGGQGASPAAPVQVAPPPLPRPPQGGYGPRPNRPPRGPGSSSGPSGPGRP